ncbi:predicted protein [Naegleria gruberi]|uniref:Predicted protein n=1 Tax=Naegleria gruberi TaxID=5762 RepID=D2VC13_NAEGR|nr:uncharacterized protein NAEGRDRAFT_66409 [Naegleria gruberi]EFC45577.1 predicted protein [Naegleria gruberi]|eukprot:XP_002678321.1 predicted protein [Naegleria gruberi strain NEG-M]
MLNYNENYSDKAYRGMLLEYFYKPLHTYAKGEGWIDESATLSIKEETNKNTKEGNVLSDDDSVDLGANLQDEQHLPSSIQLNYGNTSCLFKPKKITKKSKRKQKAPSTTNIPPIKRTAIISNRANNESRMMYLEEKDLNSTETLLTAIRNNLEITRLNNLQFKHKNIYVTVKENEVSIIKDLMKENDDTLKFCYGTKAQ